ncbi:HD-GYP domain-containing protein [Desulfogranum mediterraneum]|uniref:HD-GYP domain-containing protein n=1 Tax=Desulfogranum mediterraneum TaxID=160661 RepID=UPI000428C990|nr:HD domain-containing protein [Desulfogranum mediterraneum]
MQQNRGSIILKTAPTDDGQQAVVAYLQQHAKNIPKDKIPLLLDKLPVVLARNVPHLTALKVMAELRNLRAEASFIPAEHHRPSGESTRNEQESTRHTASQHRHRWTKRIRANRESGIILAMVVISGMLNYAVTSRYLLLGLYSLPTVMSAYYFGRRKALLTALASILLVGFICAVNPDLFHSPELMGLGGSSQWYHLVSWGSILLVIAYAMGTLHEKLQGKIQELRQTYQGILFILRHFISQDEATENHCFRVSIYAVKLAGWFELSEEAIEDIRSAALLHDIGKFPLNRDILHKATSLLESPLPDPGPESSPRRPSETTGSPLERILPMLVAPHQQSGDSQGHDKNDPRALGAEILALADHYDTLVSNRLQRRKNASQEARDLIVANSEEPNQEQPFSPRVIEAFTTLYDRGEMSIPEMLF